MNTFKRMSVLLALLALIPLAWGQSATNESPLRLTLDLVDGSRLVGVPGIASIPVQTAYARMDIELKQVQTIEMEKDRELAVFEMRNGDRVKGAMILKTLELQTAFGTVEIGAEQINTIQVTISGKATATGGTITVGDGYIIHTFTNVGTTNFVVSGGSLNCDVLVVAGGGGGGDADSGSMGCHPGGGGAGGVVYVTNFTITAKSVPVVIGNGGRSAEGSAGTPGSNSSFASFVAMGGGRGASYYVAKSALNNGGSGGGGNYGQGPGNSTHITMEEHAIGYGHDGGVGVESLPQQGAGGGGGAGGRGVAGTSTTGGNGGIGVVSPISGSTVYYGGGGGGSTLYGGGSPGLGGKGGGGNAGSAELINGMSGIQNTGGGGGAAASHTRGVSGNGGSGIVIVRYRQ